ncbi:hypothetical protein [Thiorhodococcus minor]|uniref:Uncharacterized protein n=1 Tax=Thiorhodococcus minor TaxID=57489 RepID=A0A6M0K3M6_9GAMM|nr:hypothetical protein [Thiorhodococcus minor]NEV64402.1 hypothetical protein [Thiorhodococcus minor]
MGLATVARAGTTTTSHAYNTDGSAAVRDRARTAQLAEERRVLVDQFLPTLRPSGAMSPNAVPRETTRHAH